MTTLRFDLITPSSTLFSGDAEQVNAPGTEGEFGALAGHEPFVTSLATGVVEVLSAGGVTRYFVAGGVAEVSSRGMTILADESVNLAEVTPETADKRLAEARAQRTVADTDTEKAKTAKAVALAEALRAAV